MARNGRMLSLDQLKVILDEVDTSKKRTLNFEQFCKMMNDGEDETLKLYNLILG